MMIVSVLVFSLQFYRLRSSVNKVGSNLQEEKKKPEDSRRKKRKEERSRREAITFPGTKYNFLGRKVSTNT